MTASVIIITLVEKESSARAEHAPRGDQPRLAG
jgi:hypothetical protein